MTDTAHTVATARGLADMLRREHATDGHAEMIDELLAVVAEQAAALRSTAVLLRSTADRVDGQWTRITGIDPQTLRAAAGAADEIANRTA